LEFTHEFGSHWVNLRIGRSVPATRYVDPQLIGQSLQINVSKTAQTVPMHAGDDGQ
jgi:hypothetical protein